MKRIFTDTSYYVALFWPRDSLHEKAKEASVALGKFRAVTTEEVLTEFLNVIAARAAKLRPPAALFVRKILQDPNTDVRGQTRESFRRGLDLYEQRSDKTYSLTDCISLAAMREFELTEVLSHDQHFAQEGFQILLSK